MRKIIAGSLHGKPDPYLNGLLRCMLDMKSSRNKQDNDGNTPLHIAVMTPITKRQREIIKLLTEHGASIDIKNNDQHDPLYYCGKKN